MKNSYRALIPAVVFYSAVFMTSACATDSQRDFSYERTLGALGQTAAAISDKKPDWEEDTAIRRLEGIGRLLDILQ